MKTAFSKTQAFTLVEVMIVVAIIGILTAVAFPTFVRARESSRKSTCISNLRMMDSAITSWAVEARKSLGADVETTALFGTTNLLREQPICPAGGEFTFGKVGIWPQVSCSFDTDGHTLP